MVGGVLVLNNPRAWMPPPSPLPPPPLPPPPPPPPPLPEVDVSEEVPTRAAGQGLAAGV